MSIKSFRLALQSQDAAQDIHDMRNMDPRRALDIGLIYLKAADLQRNVIKAAKAKLNEPALQFSTQKTRSIAISAGVTDNFKTKRRKKLTNDIKLQGSYEDAVCYFCSLFLLLFVLLLNRDSSPVQVMKVGELFPGDSQAASLVMQAFSSPSTEAC